MKARVTIAAVVAALAVSSTPGSAHHGPGSFPLEFTGIVESGFRLMRPHPTMLVRADGRRYRLLFGAVVRSTADFKEGTIPVGSTVIVTGRRHRLTDVEVFVNRIKWGEKTFEF